MQSSFWKSLAFAAATLAFSTWALGSLWLYTQPGASVQAASPQDASVNAAPPASIHTAASEREPAR